METNYETQYQYEQGVAAISAGKTAASIRKNVRM
jgi:hypothetical protein